MPQSAGEPTSATVDRTQVTVDPSTAERYSRQVLFAGIGAHGQQQLGRARVAIIGVGATGAAVASLLARAGVGYLRLIDRDFVEPSNLQRQILFDEADADAVLPKAEAARRKILSFNSSVTATAEITDLNPASAGHLLSGVDLLLDATDNFEARYLINDFAVLHGTPWIYSAAVGAYAATMNVLPRPAPVPDAPGAPQPALSSPKGLDSEMWVGAPPNPGAPPLALMPWVPTACLACLFPDPPSGPVQTCDTAGILATAVTLAASIQATEALKLLTGQAHLMRRTLLSFDLWAPAESGGLERAELAAGHPDPACAVCGHRRFRFLNGAGQPQITLCGRNAVQIHERRRPLLLGDLHRSLAALPEITGLRSNDMLLRFSRGEQTITVFSDGRAVIQGTTSPALARSLYARFIGP